jgi:hypothetical protein
MGILSLAGGLPSADFTPNLPGIGSIGGAAVGPGTFGMTQEAEQFSIGGVLLHGFEAPDIMHSMVRQNHVVHEFVGGGRSVQTFGQQFGPIRWEGKLVPQGTFRGIDGPDGTDLTNPIARALQLEQIATAGNVVDFTYGSLSWSVIVSEFNKDIKTRNEVDYSITLIVVQDKAGSNASAFNADSNYFIQISRLTVTTLELYDQFLADAELLAVLGANTIAALERGQLALAGIATLVATQHIFPTVPVIALANEVLYHAGYIKGLVNEIIL